MLRKIVDFHLDHEQHWVADLECGHTQHVRHKPPLVWREWVLTEVGRKEKLGAELDCLNCEEGMQVENQPVTKDKRRHIACAVLDFGNNLIGLQLRDKKPHIEHPGKISFFGGDIEKDETPQTAIQREILEELALIAGSYNCKFVGSFDYLDGFKVSSVIHLFLISGVPFNSLRVLEGHLCVTNCSDGLQYLDIVENVHQPLKAAIDLIKKS